MLCSFARCKGLKDRALAERIEKEGKPLKDGYEIPAEWLGKKEEPPEYAAMRETMAETDPTLIGNWLERMIKAFGFGPVEKAAEVESERQGCSGCAGRRDAMNKAHIKVREFLKSFS